MDTNLSPTSRTSRFHLLVLYVALKDPLFIVSDHDDRIVLPNSPLNESLTQGGSYQVLSYQVLSWMIRQTLFTALQAQNPHSLSNNLIAHAADISASPQYGVTVAPFLTATYLPIPTGVLQSGEQRPDTHWHSEYMLSPNNTRGPSLNYRPVVQMMDSSSQYSITIASSPSQATYLPSDHGSQWNAVVHAEQSALLPPDSVTLTSSMLQSMQWSNFHWQQSERIQEPNTAQLSHPSLALILPPTPSSSSSSGDPGRRRFSCPDCGDMLKSKQSLRGTYCCSAH